MLAALLKKPIWHAITAQEEDTLKDSSQEVAQN